MKISFNLIAYLGKSIQNNLSAQYVSFRKMQQISKNSYKEK